MSLPPKWLRRLKGQIVFAYRKQTWKSRANPGFLVLGAQKAGTSSLSGYLGQHPSLYPSSRKEMHFFSGGTDQRTDKYELGERWFRAHFPKRSQMSKEAKAFDNSPTYLFNPLCPERIARQIPDVKMIVLLRNPTQRAISHYFHEFNRNRETLPIQSAMECEEERLREALANQDFRHPAVKLHSYKLRGHYREQLQRYFDIFPRQQLLVLRSESMFEDPGSVVRQVFEFLEVDPELDGIDYTPVNTGDATTADVPDSTVRYLDDYFAPLNHSLYELLGEDFRW